VGSGTPNDPFNGFPLAQVPKVLRDE